MPREIAEGKEEPVSDGSLSFTAKVAMAAMLLLVMPAACGQGSDPVDTTTTAPPQSSQTQIPEEFPEPGEVEELDVLTLTDEDVHVQWEVAMSEEEVVDFYSQALVAEGWEISSQREGGDSTRFAIGGHGWDGAVTVLGGDPVKVLLQLGRSDR